MDRSSCFRFASDHPTLNILCSRGLHNILMVLCHHLPNFVETVFCMYCRFLKMDRTQQETLAEQEALLAECKLYERDKKPETKNALVKNDGEEEASTGVPVGPASTVVGNTVPRTTPWLTGFFVSLGTRDKNFSSTPWSTGLFACLGTGDKNFSSDLEVCEYCSLFF